MLEQRLVWFASVCCGFLFAVELPSASQATVNCFQCSGQECERGACQGESCMKVISYDLRSGSVSDTRYGCWAQAHIDACNDERHTDGSVIRTSCYCNTNWCNGSSKRFASFSLLTFSISVIVSLGAVFANCGFFSALS